MDYRDPNYTAEFVKRGKMLKKLVDDPYLMVEIKLHYRDNPWDFISDWGMVFEPRNLELGRIATIPMVLWPKQVEYLKWAWARWKAGERGLVEKSRDCGVTWLSVGFAIAMWLFWDGFTIGFGSRKEELVDRRGDQKSIFERLRFFIDNLPQEFLPAGFEERKHSAHMRIINPDNSAAIIGEAGDQIGRGGRASIYFVDEAAFLERQGLVDAALSQTTNCQIDISTPNGNGNLFYRKRLRFNNTSRLFVFDWRDDPRKDEAWYKRQVEEQDEVIVAQEIDRDYNASAEDSFIPAKWVAAAIDAHKVLGFEPEGIRVTAFDPADVGDARAVVNRHGSIILKAEQKRQGDITDAIPWAFEHADTFRADVLVYDGDGMGAPTMKMALQRRAAGRLRVEAYHGSAGVVDPEAEYGGIGKPFRLRSVTDRTAELHQGDALRKNIDQFINYRAQTWTWGRDRFKATYEAIQRAREGKIVNVDPDMLVSISSECKNLVELQAELSRPMRLFTPNGKIKVEAKADMKKREVESPNLADGLVMALSIRKTEDQPKPVIRNTPKIKTAASGAWMGA